MPQTLKGFSLVELMVVIGIMAITAFISYPHIMEMLWAHESRRVEHTLKQFLRNARTQSYINHANTIVCPIDANQICLRTGQNGFLVYLDTNANAKLDGKDVVLDASNKPLRYGSITLNASAKRHHLRYLAGQGRPVGHFGHFRYCSISANARLSFKLIINAQGNVRTERQDLVDIGC